MSSFLHDFIHLSCVGQAEYTVRDSLGAVFMRLFEPGIYWNTMKSELDSWIWDSALLGLCFIHINFLSSKRSYLSPCPPAREAAVELPFLCFYDAQGEEETKQNISSCLLLWLWVGSWVPSWACAVLSVTWWDIALGMLWRWDLLEDKEKVLQKRWQQAQELWKLRFGYFAGPLCVCPCRGELLGRTSWWSQESWSMEKAQERGPGE